MRMRSATLFGILSLLLLASGAPRVSYAQETAADRLSQPFGDPSRPGTLHANLLYGSITVQGYEGDAVIVEARMRDAASERATGLYIVEEAGNVMRVIVNNQPIDLHIQVPVNTSLKVATNNDGDIQVDEIQGEVEASNLNGAVTLTRIAGAAVVDAMNDDITVAFTHVDPDKPMSFSTLNGDIDVTFPSDVQANVYVETEYGTISSDFDLGPALPSRTSSTPHRRGRWHTIGSGGPAFMFINANGNISLRKRR